MKIYLYMDEDSMDKRYVSTLRTHGIDVLTAQEAKMLDKDDDEHLDYATKQNRVLVSFNRRDFFALHTQYLKEGKRHAGIILSPQQTYSVGEYVRRITNLVEKKSAEEMRDHLEFLSDWGE